MMRLDLRADAVMGRLRGILGNRGRLSSGVEVTTMSGLRALVSAIPCPAWLAEAAEAHARRREFVLQIHAVAGRDAAFAALWLARGVALASWRPNSETVEAVLRLCRDVAMEGGRRPWWKYPC